MFFLNQRYFEPLLQGIIDRDLGLKMWSYTRIDTVREKFLDLFKKAGINWLAVGIEADNREVRREVSKGTFALEDVSPVVKLIQKHDIGVAANYIFGFPDDTMETMKQTLGWQLPDTYQGYGFLSYEASPLATKHVSAAEVVRFRDMAWQRYHENPAFLNLIENKFGESARQGIVDLSKVKLKRRILGD